jgi:hypothetical protein
VKGEYTGTEVHVELNKTGRYERHRLVLYTPVLIYHHESMTCLQYRSAQRGQRRDPEPFHKWKWPGEFRARLGAVQDEG